MTKLKVRQAIWHAVDRKQIADKLVGGGSRVPPAPCFPSQFGCDADAAVKYDYDPAKAKAAAGRGRLSQRLRRRDGELCAADHSGARRSRTT
jgi:ABC-type oligopeptide transport system substrate-binding subunit